MTQQIPHIVVQLLDIIMEQIWQCYPYWFFTYSNYMLIQIILEYCVKTPIAHRILYSDILVSKHSYPAIVYACMEANVNMI